MKDYLFEITGIDPDGSLHTWKRTIRDYTCRHALETLQTQLRNAFNGASRKIRSVLPIL